MDLTDMPQLRRAVLGDNHPTPRRCDAPPPVKEAPGIVGYVGAAIVLVGLAAGGLWLALIVLRFLAGIIL